jgi:hypothetical protein
MRGGPGLLREQLRQALPKLVLVVRQLGQTMVQLVHSPRRCFTLLVIPLQRGQQLNIAAEARADGTREQIRVAERVADPAREDRVLVVRGVAGERPARTERPTEIRRLIEHAPQRRVQCRARERVGHLRERPQRAHVVARFVGAERVALRPGDLDERQYLAIIGRKDARRAAWAEEQRDAVE